MSKKTKIMLFVGVSVIVAAVLVLCFLIVGRRHPPKPSRIFISSYDGQASYYVDIDNDNITEASVTTANGIQRAIVSYKDEDAFAKQIKSNPAFKRTYDYVSDDGKKKTVLLSFSQGYYFTVELHIEGENVALVTSLYASISLVDVYPLFNSTILIPFEINDGEPSGGSKTYTLDEFNAMGRYKMTENAITSYSDLKNYFSELSDDVYDCNDEGQIIYIKLYSTVPLSDGSHYYNGFPISVCFSDENTVVVSVNSAILSAA